MKRLVLFLLALLVLAVTIPAAAQDALAPDEITGEVVYIPFPVTITLDGKLDDWAGVPVETVDRGTLISPDPAQTAAFQFAVAADADTIYVTMQTRRREHHHRAARHRFLERRLVRVLPEPERRPLRDRLRRRHLPDQH